MKICILVRESVNYTKVIYLDENVLDVCNVLCSTGL